MIELIRIINNSFTRRTFFLNWKFYCYFILPLLLIVITLVESRESLSLISSYVGTGSYEDFGKFISQYARNEVQSILLVPYVIVRILDLPFNFVEILFYNIFRLIGCIGFYFFIYRYLSTIFGEPRNIIICSAFAGALIFLHYPYNVYPTFPALFAITSLAPIFLLVMLEGYERKKISLFSLSILILTFLVLADPRAIQFIIPAAAFLVLIPRLLSSKSFKKKIV